MYKAPSKEFWKGRIDSTDNISDFRWHQVVKMIDLSKPVEKTENGRTICFLGFASDEGVRRNQGRVGAANGPTAIRKAMSNLAVHHNPAHLTLADAGDVLCTNGKLETAQLLLAEKVKMILQNKCFPILLGGGHEIAYGHYKGIADFYDHEKAGIINFDAHFDLRPFTYGVSSGTPFLQIMEEKSYQGNFPYFCIGIQKASNTKSLFDTADANGVQYIPADQVNIQNIETLNSAINNFLSDLDKVYVSIDLDVFASAFAPGVSAPALNGIFPDIAIQLMSTIFASGKVVSLDIAELNPDFDIDNRTAKLAAYLIFETVTMNNEQCEQ